MSVAFIDTSCLVAIVFSEPGAAKVARRLKGFDQVFASTLLESELRSAARREDIVLDESVLDSIQWVWPDRRLTPEIQRVLKTGYLRGADGWHIACALFLFDSIPGVTFLTLDSQQQAVAQRLGFLI